MKDKYIRQSKEFFYNLVKPYVEKILKMINNKEDINDSWFI